MAVMKLAGITFDNDDGTSRQHVLRRIFDELYTEGREEEIELRLEHERFNKGGDPDAVAVFVDGPPGYEGKVGYVPAEYAKKVREALRRGRLGRVRFRDMQAGTGGNVFAVLGLAARKDP